jgi:hypothetical protein
MEALRENLKTRNIEILGSISVREDWKKHRHLLEAADLVIVNGEGCLHHGRRLDLLEVAQEYPAVLINAVYQDMPEHPALKAFERVYVRESLSQAEVEKHGVEAKVVPDLIFYHDIPRPEVTEDVVIVDSVQRSGGLVPKDKEFIEKQGRAKEVLTGRFHSVCLAVMWDQPFKAGASNSHKIEGLLKDVCPDYTEKARKAIQQMFDEIATRK